MTIDQPITLEDYKDGIADEFFAKYHYVNDQLGGNAKAEDILKVMESLAGLIMKKRSENKKTNIGFNKTNE